MFKMPHLRDMSPQAPVYTTAFVTYQDSSINRCPARILHAAVCAHLQALQPLGHDGEGPGPRFRSEERCNE